MFKLKLVKGLSYSDGKISVNIASPFIEISDEEQAQKLVDSGYFQLIEVSDYNIDPVFSKMTLPELKKYAKDNNIDLKGATKKEDILKLILSVESSEDENKHDE